MDRLIEILDVKVREVALKKNQQPLHQLITSPLFERDCISLKESVLNTGGIIAEFKRKSPSSGALGNDLHAVVRRYEGQPLAGISVLTDEFFFGGSVDDLVEARRITTHPILRKDFIIDEYQVFEAKAMGADAVLLIAEALDEYHLTSLATIAQSIGLEVLVEIHQKESLSKIKDNFDIIGVNNRDLSSLEISLEISEKLSRNLPSNSVRISESGIQLPSDIEHLRGYGFDGFLIGTSVLKDESLLKSLVNAADNSKNVMA